MPFGVNSYQCYHYDSQFSRESYFKRHLIIHTEENHTSAVIVIRLVLEIVIFIHIWWYTLGRNHIISTFMIRLSIEIVIYKHKSWCILGSILISAVSVINYSEGILNWKITCQYILERSHISAPIVLSHSIEITICKGMWWYIMRRNHIMADADKVINLSRNCDIQRQMVIHTGERLWLYSEYNKIIP